MKISNKKNIRYTPYSKINNYNYINIEILNNIKKLYNNVRSDQKTNILSIVSYDNIKNLLRNIGFKFTKSQFQKATLNRIKEIFNLNSYKRSVPKSKKKLNKQEIQNILSYIDYYSRESSSKENNVKYLEYSKKYIYN